MEEGEERVAVAGAFNRRAGCLLTPLIPVRAAGALIVTTKRVIFEPVLHYKLFARKWSAEVEQISGAESTGANWSINIMDLVSIGKDLTIRLKDGSKYRVRSSDADILAEAINFVVRGPRES